MTDGTAYDGKAFCICGFLPIRENGPVVNSSEFSIDWKGVDRIGDRHSRLQSNLSRAGGRSGRGVGFWEGKLPHRSRARRTKRNSAATDFASDQRRLMTTKFAL